MIKFYHKEKFYIFELVYRPTFLHGELSEIVFLVLFFNIHNIGGRGARARSFRPPLIQATDLDIYMLRHVFILLCYGPVFKNLFYMKWLVYTKISVTKCSVEPQYQI